MAIEEHAHSTGPGPDRFRQTLQLPYGSRYLDVDPPLYGDGDASMDGYESIHGASVSPNIQGHESFQSSPMMDIPHQWTVPESIPTWDLVSMGLEEALPDPDVVDELHRIYFEVIHPCVPLIHRARYYASLNMAPSLRPPIALRYAMWTLAASVSDEKKYSNMQTHFYKRARKYLEESEMKGHGENVITVTAQGARHVQ